MASLWKQTQQRATHHKDCKECAALTSAVEQARASLARHLEAGVGLCGRYGEASGLELKQAA